MTPENAASARSSPTTRQEPSASPASAAKPSAAKSSAAKSSAVKCSAVKCSSATSARTGAPGAPSEDCPLQVAQRVRRLRHAINGLRFKIEGVALLSDMLGERLAVAAATPVQCGADHGGCDEQACRLAKCAEELENAFDRVAQRIEALHQASENARRIAAAPAVDGAK